MIRTVIVGAGPAGLAVAFKLAGRPGQEVLLLERAPQVGGLAAGFRHGGYTLDYGPHRLHPGTDPEVLADLRALLGQRLVQKPRRGRIRLRGRYFSYPLGPSALWDIGPGRTLQFAAGAVAARFARWEGAPRSYEQALLRRVGRPLYEAFYRPYAEKVWGCSGSQIAADQADRRVNQRGLRDLVTLATGRMARATYLYPSDGFGSIPRAYAGAVEAAPNTTVFCDTTVDAVSWSPEGAGEVTYTEGGRTRSVQAGHLVWTAPLPELVRRMRPAPPPSVLQAVASLRYRAVVLCYVVLSVPRVGYADTYYFPEAAYPFNRVMEQKTFSEQLAPPDRTVLCMDISCDGDGEVFSAADDDLLGLVAPGLEEAGLLRGSDVAEVFSRRFRHAYPIYDSRYRAALDEALGWLDRFPNIRTAGRQGLFLHNNTHHSLLMGYRAAEAIVGGGSTSSWRIARREFESFRVAD